MPIHSCKLPGGGSGYMWGNHGKCFKSRKQAQRQAAAAFANGYKGEGGLKAFLEQEDEQDKQVIADIIDNYEQLSDSQKILWHLVQNCEECLQK